MTAQTFRTQRADVALGAAVTIPGRKACATCLRCGVTRQVKQSTVRKPAPYCQDCTHDARRMGWWG